MPQINGVKVTPQQEAIYNLLARFDTGLTDHALVGVATHELTKPYSESGIRSRRCELADAGLVQLVGTVKVRSGRVAARWAAV